MKFNILYENDNLLVIEKPAKITVFPEGQNPPTGGEKTVIELLLEEFPQLKTAGNPPRYGIIHRIDKDTSGILLVAKTSQALDFFQKEFQNQKVAKKYLALVVGKMKESQGIIDGLIGRSQNDKRKQKIYLAGEPKSQNKRKAITEYKVVEQFDKYTLVEARPKTGRKHQIRTHLAHINHPVAGDKLYGFKNQPRPEGLDRQFLHSSYLKIKLPSGEEKEFTSKLPEDLGKVLKNLDK